MFVVVVLVAFVGVVAFVFLVRFLCCLWFVSCLRCFGGGEPYFVYAIMCLFVFWQAMCFCVFVIIGLFVCVCVFFFGGGGLLCECCVSVVLLVVVCRWFRVLFVACSVLCVFGLLVSCSCVC